MKRAETKIGKYPVLKLSKLIKAVKELFHSVLDESVIASYEEENENYNAAGEEMIVQLKEKFKSTTNISERIHILSVLPQSWSVSKIKGNFTYY